MAKIVYELILKVTVDNNIYQDAHSQQNNSLFCP